MFNWLFHRRTRKDAFSQKALDFGILEKKLVDPCVTPMPLPLEFLECITRGFSEEQELGSGGFGVVYKGVLQNGKTIAVKKLKDIHLDNNEFNKEVTYLIGLKHENIVQLIGYCAESRSQATEISDGKYVMAEIRHRLICFEYLNKKSLDKYLSAEPSGLEWHITYQIIKGICCGLHYLHSECHIIHLDLKPQNILMDDNMVPKIADFGMSRLFGEQQSRIVTQNPGGTFGYMAPEYLNRGFISTKSDIFSLGVIIVELLIGSRSYPDNSTEGPFVHFIENVVAKWRNRFKNSLNHHTSLETYIQQVETCTKIGLRCVDSDPKKRPHTLKILEILTAAETGNMLVDEASWSSFGDVKAKVPSSGPSNSEKREFSFGVAISPGKLALMGVCVEVRIEDVDGDKVGLFGIYDGHGEVRAAQYLEDYLFRNLVKHPKFITDTKSAIAETYNRTDSEFLKVDSRHTDSDAGSTALTAIIEGDRLLVANVGASRAVICKGGQAIAVSRDHRPEQSDERQRIEDAGGFVMWFAGRWLVSGILDVSRAFGHKTLKQFVVADPDIKEEVIDSSLEFLILATDGVWGVVSNEEAVAMVKHIQHPQEAADRLLQEAYHRGSSNNNIVVIVHFLDETTGDKLHI